MFIPYTPCCYYIVEGTLNCDFCVKSGIANLDNNVVLMKPSRFSAPQTFPAASIMSFTHCSTACVWTGNDFNVTSQLGAESLWIIDVISSSFISFNNGGEDKSQSNQWIIS